MDPIIERRAEELGKLLAESDEFKRLQAARAELERHSAAQIMLRDLQQRQERLRAKQLEGKPITEAEIAELQQFSQVVSMNPFVRQLLEAELAFSETWLQVQRILGKAVGLSIPDEAEGGEAGENETRATQAESAHDDAASKARSRLWVPGR